MTQAQFDRIVFAVRNIFTQDIAETTIKALSDTVEEWVKFKHEEAEKQTAPAEELEQAETTEGE